MRSGSPVTRFSDRFDFAYWEKDPVHSGSGGVAAAEDEETAGLYVVGAVGEEVSGDELRASGIAHQP